MNSVLGYGAWRKKTNVQHLIPEFICHRISEPILLMLIEHGYRTVLFDVDNTIAARKSSEMLSGVVDAVLRCYSLYNEPVRFALLSNTVVRSRKRSHRVKTFAQQLSISDRECHWVCANWPFIKPNPRPFRRILAALNADPLTTIMIGDQLFTDVLGAHRAGIAAMLVQPLGKDHNPVTNHRRRKEKKLCDQLGLQFPHEGFIEPRLLPDES